MNWLKRIFSAEPSSLPRAGPEDARDLVRAGYDRESSGDIPGAERDYRRALERDPGYSRALYYLARLAGADRRQDEAISLFQGAVLHCPDEALYHLALGDALLDSRQFAEAVKSYEACRAILPDCTVLANNYAGALVELNRREEARAIFEEIRESFPNTSELHFNLGGIYREYGRSNDAIAAYRRALELKPGHAPTFSNYVLELNMGPELSAEEIFAEHRRFGEHFARHYSAPVADRAWPRRLRIGYVSPDFRNHVVSFFMEPVLAHHDHARFEIFCYDTQRQKDRVTQMLRPLADHWIDSEDLPDAQLAERIRADRIDILVDLSGHTADNRLLVFAEKPAPIQVTYLGYPNTTGLTTVDYRITDAIADPPGESDRLNTERLVRLPGSHFCFRPGPDAPPVEPLPAASASGVTFGCFNHFAKISGAFLDTVARVLLAVPGSRFILKGRPLSIQAVARNVRERFERAGVDPARLDLRGWEPTARSHLKIYGSVDIALDSFPYSGATTTCEALWMGVPVVTFAGDRHASRMCASILTTVGLSEWIARDRDGYVALAVKLSSDLARLANMRRTMRDRVRASPLMDETGFCRKLEQCYIEMWERSVISAPQRAAPGPEALDAMLERARGLRQTGKKIEAAEACREILQRSADHFGALELLWDIGFESGAPGIAIDRLVKAMAIDEREPRLPYMLGCALQAGGKIDDAIIAFRRAVALDPGMAKAHNNLGNTLEAVGRLDEAAQAYSRAIELDPTLAHALYNLGTLRDRAGDWTRAIDYFKQALAIEPRNPQWRLRLGQIQCRELRLDEAIANLQTVLALDPSEEVAHMSLGSALLIMGRVEEGIAAWRKALELNPANSQLESAMLFAAHYRENDPRRLFERHLSWARRHARGLLRLTTTRALNPPAPGRRLNVGYLSPDFGPNPLTQFIEPALAAHDRREFGIFCYSNSSSEDDTTRRLRDLDCTWRDISFLSDFQAADRIRGDGIDILVDLAGHSGGGRPLVFAMKPAPVQVSWLGYPGTTGLAEMDYLLTDAIADPDGENERHHTEKLVRLPCGFLCYLPPPDAPELEAPPELGPGHVTFACFSDLAKLTDEMVATWSELLRALPRARLVMKAQGFHAESARRRVFELFAANGIAADRIDPSAPEALHARRLAKYQDVDVALDVFPCNGLTATCEALWMGVPVVTLAGTTHASRVGASILESAGLPQLVAGTRREYVEIAMGLAQDFLGRRDLRAGMRERMRSSPLMDGAAFARKLEAAYRMMLAEISRGSTAAPLPAIGDSAADGPGDTAPPLRLHIGGQQPRPGWKIVNIQPGPGVDYIGDCSDLGPFADASADEIYASHVLEHLGYQDKLPQALAEIHRVLKPGGAVKISVPDFEVICRLFLEPERTEEQRLLLMRMAFGGQMDAHDFHYVGLTHEILGGYLSRAGFVRIEKVAEFHLFRDTSSYRFGNTLISLNVIAYKA
jgi:predicted O-linked N-acetylglucosamine transferase (SPINDLY family)/predicted SAM-dependent methyltransferase